MHRGRAHRAFLWVIALLLPLSVLAASNPNPDFPRSLDTYHSAPGASLWTVLHDRIQSEPFNLAATVIFFLAILHTFLAPMFIRLSHRFERNHRELLKAMATSATGIEEVSFRAEAFHFLGEVEAVFGIWVVPLMIAISAEKGWSAAQYYFDRHLSFTEPIFVVVIMTIAASRPILRLAEQSVGVFARLGRGTPGAWWLAILTLGPALGSIVTEPAAMTISALLLAEKFYERQPKPVLAYSTLGLLFVNVSVGGTLTHFAAPPVLMVSAKWGWGTSYMLGHFGWKAFVGIAAANLLYFLFLRREFNRLPPPQPPLDVEMVQYKGNDREPIPIWITVVHLIFLGWTIMNGHHAALFVGGFLFYLAFTQATQQHQFQLNLRPPLLVGFFLAGLVVHGGLQSWWIEPVLTRLSEIPLFLGATFLTAFNDNAAITYLASLVPGFSPELKYAVVAGAVTGGGLTVIANAPNPAGQSILAKYFPDGVSPLYLFLGAVVPTALVGIAFMLLR